MEQQHFTDSVEVGSVHSSDLEELESRDLPVQRSPLVSEESKLEGF